MMLVKDKHEPSHRHLCVVKNNYMPETNKNESYVLQFNEQLAFENTGKRVNLDELVEEDYLPLAKQLKNDGKSIRAIAKELNDKGHEVLVQNNGGFEAGFTNEDYEKSGAKIKY